ncbi:hypothetical protein PZB75_22270 [Streptomyces sp. AM 4-1-1]|uniref:hypothetical protein n=1 Tax=Streptomyces sp. AM 4-1-1 TaxID=3028710 RepID=UPI0023B8FB56|nr:hypothetical protein [Streptomyces sp. AM 4-1-1]WEH35839.1 hypothetical protein PZB75_22270 [Streptomyces sp. AM 4-1-1]
MDQSNTSSRLAGAVRDLASEVVFALRSGDHFATVCGAAGIGEDDRTGIAAVRVIGADLLLPSILYGRVPHPGDMAVLQRAVREFPPRADGPAATAWSHWAMTSALHRLTRPETSPVTGTAETPETAAFTGTTASEGITRAGGTAGNSVFPDNPTALGITVEPGNEPDVGWLEEAPWQSLTHQLSILAPLAVPGGASAVQRAADRRSVDVARGFVRAVRRRDWLQAAGAGRWLTVLHSVPDTLGLDTGLEFVQLMGGQDPRVALHLRAAGLIRSGTPR